MLLFTRLFGRTQTQEEESPLGSLSETSVKEDEDDVPPPLPPRPKAAKPNLDLTDPKQLCQYVDSLQQRLNHTENLCEKAEKQIQAYRKEIEDLQAKVHELQVKEVHRVNELNALRTSSNNLVEKNKLATTLLDEEKLKRISQTREALHYEEETVRGMLKLRRLDHEVSQNSAETVLERSLEEQAVLPCQPFVVVLIDGDGYRFSESWKKCGDDPGVAIAQRLWLEVSKIILTNRHIPAHSKIVVRIFFNGRSRKNSVGKRYNATEEMMIRFAETQPLFDYIDCGGGKERADDKLRENAHLYIGNQNCHAVLLAVCNDNGYARMLERYQLNSLANAKIFLIAAGAIVTEIERLPFTRVVLPAVFEDMCWITPAGSKPSKPNWKTSLTQNQAPQRKIMPAPATGTGAKATCQRLRPCKFGTACTTPHCSYIHPAGFSEVVPAFNPSAAPATNEKKGLLTSSSPAKEMLHGVIRERKQPPVSKDSVAKKNKKNPMPKKSRPAQKPKPQKQVPPSSYLAFIQVNQALPARLHDDPYLVPFPFRWSLGKTDERKEDRSRQRGKEENDVD